VRHSFEKDEVNQVKGVSMNRKLLTLLFASLFAVILSSGALAAPPSIGVGAAPMAPATGLVIDSPSNGSYLNSVNITVSWHIVGPTSSVQYYLVKVDGGAWINNSLRTSITLIMPEDGMHLVDVQAWTELEGLYSANVFFVVDRAPPTVIWHGPTGSGVPISSAIVISFSEPMQTSEVKVTGVQGHSSWEGANLTLTPNEPLLLDQEYTIVVSGQDLAGNNISGYSWSFSTTNQGTLTGQVRDDSNNTVADAEVVLLLKGEVVASTTTDSQGMFQLSAPSGTYNLTISKSEIITRTVSVEIISGEETDLGVVSVELTPDYTWVLINVVIIAGAVGLFLVGRRNQKLRKK
jgi:hypothetical protein